MSQSEVRKIIRQLKKAEISVFDVPEDYKSNKQIITFERKAGLRITGKRGFDIISNSFFVEESLLHTNTDGTEHCSDVFYTFDDFDSYFDFLNGTVYDTACYTFLPERIDVSCNVDRQRLMEKKAFIEDTVDDYSLPVSEKDSFVYETAKETHKLCQQWIKKFNACTSYKQLLKTVNNYEKSKIAPVVDVTFFLYQYVFADVNNEERFHTIMEYMSSGAYPEYKMINALCSIYDPAKVLQAYQYSLGAKATISKHKKKLKEYILSLANGEIEFYSKGYFDKKTQFYCQEMQGYQKGNNHFPVATIYRYFTTFNEFADYLNRDLTYCDLSGALGCDIDLSAYSVDETTKLPPQTKAESIYSIEKCYRNQKFYVTQRWETADGSILKEATHTFNYFFDFVAFLKNDLSGADLLFCDGLKFLNQWDTIDFSNAKMTSSLCEKFGLNYEAQKINDALIESFDCVEQNESTTALVLQSSRDLVEDAAEKNLSAVEICYDINCKRVHYISDLHLMHRLQNANCRSKADIQYVLQKIADTIACEVGSLLLIDGDVSSDFSIFRLFVKILSTTLPRKTQVVFTLGNHELWSFPGLTIDQIVSKYRSLLNKYGMYLLQNHLFYKDGGSEHSGVHLLQYKDLCAMDEKQISDCLRCARYVILGGLGFSGYNTEFNADNGIYRTTMDRSTEIKESKAFEALYDRLCPILGKKNAIILTHTPKQDWCRNKVPDPNFVYVSGHTHRNFFHDDGEYRIYSDNQIGYHSENPHLKSFLIDNTYDCFSDYSDGIYEITREQYIDFYRGKNISMTFQREINVLYMLKKSGYYCFIHESLNGNLAILNGGAMKRLEVQDIQYYYEHMDAMIATIKNPLDKFSTYQKQIASMIKKFGGSGFIHGSIIDIDYWNHIYVNPFDLSIAGYWATDIVHKIIYPSIPDLLEKNCPVLYGKYVKFLNGNSENPLAVKQQNAVSQSSQLYLETDIYKASREIKKMQRLNSNILTTWYDGALPEMPKIDLV